MSLRRRAVRAWNSFALQRALTSKGSSWMPCSALGADTRLPVSSS
jgi:hypothetical protein